MQKEKISNGASDKQRQTKPAVKQPKISSQRKNEIISNPAVKKVLIGLDATITGIEEDQEN